MILESKEVKAQSLTAMRQWEGLWKKNGALNNKIYVKSKDRLTDLLFRGTGKTCLVLAFGHSFEKDLETIQEMRKKNESFEVICVDKCLKYLDFAPDYVILADAQVSDEWMEGVDTSKSTLISNICANPAWSEKWQGRIIYYVNKDNIETEKVFGKGGGITECSEMIPAASNVGNAAVVIAATIFNYDKILLSGYDFCFTDDYYAFYADHPQEHRNKKYYMAHRLTLSNAGEIVKTSENLLFSGKWLSDFVKVSPPTIFNTTKNSIAHIPFQDLRRQLLKAKKRKLEDIEKSRIVDTMKVRVVARDLAAFQELMKTKPEIFDITVSVIPEEIKWLNLEN